MLPSTSTSPTLNPSAGSWIDEADGSALIAETRQQYRRRIAGRTSARAGNGAGRDASVVDFSEPRTLGDDGLVAPTGSAEHPQYEILGIIGTGNSTTVYRAYDREVRRFIAIKQLDDRKQFDKFWATARFLGGLTHDNIVRVHGFERDRQWVIMELMRGTLAERVAQDGPIGLDLARSVLKQALSGLSYLHDHGKLHGELSPRALLIDDDGRIRLCDSPGYSTDSEFSLPQGTERQLAPELLSPAIFGRVGPATDLYRLGFTLIELLLGPKFPSMFRSELTRDEIDTAGWLRWHASPTEQLPNLSEWIPGLPADLKTVLSRMTRKKVRERYQSAREALEDLTESPLVRVDAGDTDEDDGLSAPEQSTNAPNAIHIGTPVNIYADPNDPDLGPMPWFERLSDPEWLGSQFQKPRVQIGVGASTLILTLLIWFGLGQRKAQIKFVTEPAGASILVDKVPLELETPALIDLQTGRQYIVRFEKQGYVPRDVPILVETDSTIRQTLSAVEDAGIDEKRNDPPPPPPAAAVRLESDPPGVGVTVNDDPKVLTTPAVVRLTPGQLYAFRFASPGYQTLQKTRFIPAGTEQDVIKAELEPIPDIPVRVSVESEPAGATIWINDEPQDAPTPAVVDLKRGRVHVIRLSADGYEPVEWTVDMTEEEFEIQFFQELAPVVADVEPDGEETHTLVALVPNRDPWPIAGVSSDVDARQVERAIRKILGDAWRGRNPLEAVAVARSTYEAVLPVGHREPRLHAAYALLLSQRHQTTRAEEPLRSAITAQADNWNAYQPISDLVTRPSVQPYIAPQRELIRLQLSQGQNTPADYERALLTCSAFMDDLEKYFPRSADDEWVQAERRRNLEYLGTSLGAAAIYDDATRRRFDFEAHFERILARLAADEQDILLQQQYEVRQRCDALVERDAARLAAQNAGRQRLIDEEYYPRHEIEMLEERGLNRDSHTELEQRRLVADDEENLPYFQEYGRNRRHSLTKRSIFQRLDAPGLPKFSDSQFLANYLPPSLETKRAELLRTLPDEPLPRADVRLSELR